MNGPEKRSDRVAGFLVVVGNDRRDLFAGDFGFEDVAIFKPASGIQRRVSASLLRIPLPSVQTPVVGRLRCESIGKSASIGFFKKAKLTACEVCKRMFAAVDVPQVELSMMSAPNATCPKPAQRCAMPRAIV